MWIIFTSINVDYLFYVRYYTERGCSCMLDGIIERKSILESKLKKVEPGSVKSHLVDSVHVEMQILVEESRFSDGFNEANTTLEYLFDALLPSLSNNVLRVLAEMIKTDRCLTDQQLLDRGVDILALRNNSDDKS